MVPEVTHSAKKYALRASCSWLESYGHEESEDGAMTCRCRSKSPACKLRKSCQQIVLPILKTQRAVTGNWREEHSSHSEGQTIVKARRVVNWKNNVLPDWAILPALRQSWDSCLCQSESWFGHSTHDHVLYSRQCLCFCQSLLLFEHIWWKPCAAEAVPFVLDLQGPPVCVNLPASIVPSGIVAFQHHVFHTVLLVALPQSHQLCIPCCLKSKRI
jgi:hypothetical protein